jgi:hypothetical protein
MALASLQHIKHSISARMALCTATLASLGHVPVLIPPGNEGPFCRLLDSWATAEALEPDTEAEVGKHMTSPLQSPTGQCCLGKRSLFIARTMRNTQVHCVGRVRGFFVVSSDGTYGYRSFSRHVCLHHDHAVSKPGNSSRITDMSKDTAPLSSDGSA